jgi:integrase
MPKFIRDAELRELQKDSRTGIYFVRKKLKNKPELLKSTGFKDRTRARRVALEILAKYVADQPAKKEDNPTFREIAQKVLALKSAKSPATQALAKNRLEKHLGPYFNHMKVADITENTWEQYIVDQLAIKKRTLADDAKLMMACMKYSFNENLLKRKVRIRNPDPPNEEGRAYTESEIFSLLSNSSTPDMRLQIQIGLTMGMRHGEIAHLRWAWIDLEKAVIKLPPEETKTRRGRVVQINSEVLKELKIRKEVSTSPCVFPSIKNPLEPIPDFDSQWQRTWKRAEVDGVFHWTRHTCISNMAAAGVPESTIKKITGCSQRTLNKVYIHLKSDVAQDAVNLGHGGTK